MGAARLWPGQGHQEQSWPGGGGPYLTHVHKYSSEGEAGGEGAVLLSAGSRAGRVREVLREPRTGLPARVGGVPRRDGGDDGHPSRSSRGRGGLGCGVRGVGALPPRCGDAGRGSPSCPVALLGTRAARRPLIAPLCPRSAWVFPRPRPTRWRGPGRRIGRLRSEGRASGGQTALLRAVKGWVPHLTAKHPSFGGGPGEAAPVPVPRPHPLHRGSCPRTSGCGSVPWNRHSRSDVASGSRTTVRPSRLFQPAR